MANQQSLMNNHPSPPQGIPPLRQQAQSSEEEQQKKPAASKVSKPKRPLSAYNIFYKYARDILVSVDGDESKMELNATPEDVARLSRQDKKKPPKRVHRRTHGRMSFLDMARVVSAQWKQLPPEKKKVFEDQAKLEKQEYDRNVKEWKKYAEQTEEKEVDYSADSSDESLPPPVEDVISGHQRTAAPSMTLREGQADWEGLFSFPTERSLPEDLMAHGSAVAQRSVDRIHPGGRTPTFGPSRAAAGTDFQAFRGFSNPSTSYAQAFHPNPTVLNPAAATAAAVAAEQRPPTGTAGSLQQDQQQQEQDMTNLFSCSDPLDPDEMETLFD